MTAEIVVGTDGSPTGERAIAWAAQEAVRHDVPLRLVHALPSWAVSLTPSRRHRELALWWRLETQMIMRRSATLAAREAPGVRVRSVTRGASVPAALLAESREARMVVIGNHGRGGLRSLLLGSVGFKLAGRLPVPMVVVRGKGRQIPGDVAVGLDGSSDADALLGFAFDEARRRGGMVRAVRAWTPPMPPAAPGVPSVVPMTPYGPDEAAELLTATLEPWREKYPEVKVAEKVQCGAPLQVLTEVSDQVDLLVVGARDSGELAALVLGSVSRELLHRSRCPLAIVNAAQPTNEH